MFLKYTRHPKPIADLKTARLDRYKIIICSKKKCKIYRCTKTGAKDKYNGRSERILIEVIKQKKIANLSLVKIKILQTKHQFSKFEVSIFRGF